MRISRGKDITPNVNIDETNEGNEINDNTSCDYDASVEDSEMRSSEDSVNDDDENLVSGFDESTCSGDSVSDILDN